MAPESGEDECVPTHAACGVSSLGGRPPEAVEDGLARRLGAELLTEAGKRGGEQGVSPSWVVWGPRRCWWVAGWVCRSGGGRADADPGALGGRLWADPRFTSRSLLTDVGQTALIYLSRGGFLGHMLLTLFL